MLTRQTVELDVCCSTVAFYDSDLYCPFCDESYVSISEVDGSTRYICSSCGNVWEVMHGEAG